MVSISLVLLPRLFFFVKSSGTLDSNNFGRSSKILDFFLTSGGTGVAALLEEITLLLLLLSIDTFVLVAPGNCVLRNTWDAVEELDILTSFLHRFFVSSEGKFSFGKTILLSFAWLSL